MGKLYFFIHTVEFLSFGDIRQIAVAYERSIAYESLGAGWSSAWMSVDKYGISSVSVAKSANTHVKLETTLKTTFFLSIFVYVLLSASSAMSVTYADAERQRLVTLLSQVSLTAAGPDAPYLSITTYM